jgi:serine/threonine-protein kinase
MPPQLQMGTILRGRYRILKVIFETMLVNVYYVNDLHMPDKAWVVREMQMIAIDNTDRSRVIKKFYAEASRISSISHPYIGTVVDFFAEGTNFYIVREYIHGADLATILKRNQRPFLESDVVLWSAQLAEALSFLYTSKFPAIFFREFHMSNIICTAAGSVKLIDLGLAGIFQTENDSDNMNRLGSTDYAPPEQFTEEGTFDLRSLVYTLGAFMYHAVTNVNPATSPFALKPLNLLNPTLSSVIQDIINKSTDIDPRRRYQTLNDMRKDLLALLKNPKLATVKIEKEKPRNNGKDKENEGGPLNWILGVILVLVMGTILFLIYYFLLKP